MWARFSTARLGSRRRAATIAQHIRGYPRNGSLRPHVVNYVDRRSHRRDSLVCVCSQESSVLLLLLGPDRPIRRKDNRWSIHQLHCIRGHWYYSSHPSRSCTTAAAIPASILPTFYKIVFTRKNGPMAVHVRSDCVRLRSANCSTDCEEEKRDTVFPSAADESLTLILPNTLPRAKFWRS